MNSLSNVPIQDNFPKDRIFIVYGHSGELTKGTSRNIERAEQRFERYNIPSDTFTVNTMPVSLAATPVPLDKFYPLLETGFKIPDITDPIEEYKHDVRNLGRTLFANSYMIDPSGMARMVFDMAYEIDSFTNNTQKEKERFRSHGPKHPSSRNQVNKEDNYYLFSAPNNNINVFTADSAEPNWSQIKNDIYKCGREWKPSGAMKLQDVKTRFPVISDDDPILIKSLFDTYTFDQIRSNYNNCVTNISEETKNNFLEQIKNTTCSSTNIHTGVNNQIQKIENYTVWNILPIPGTQEILTKENFGKLKISDLFNKPIQAKSCIDWIRLAAGPGPILVIFQHCRSVLIQGNSEWRNDKNVGDRSQMQAVVSKFGRPLLARQLSNRGQGITPWTAGGRKTYRKTYRKKLNRRGRKAKRTRKQK